MLELIKYIKSSPINKFEKRLYIILIIIFICIDFSNIIHNKYEKYLNCASLKSLKYNQDFLIINRYEHFITHNISIIHQDSILEIPKLNENEDFIILITESSNIKNIFLLFTIFPFINDKSSIKSNFKTKSIYKLFKNIFDNKKRFSKHIIFNKSDLKYLLENHYKFIYNKWDTIPNNNFLKSTRYIINKYYNESFLMMFDLALNLNFEYYITSKKSKFSFNEISDLMSKLNYLYV